MARSFNGTTDRIDYANVANLAGSAWSVSMWFRPTTLTKTVMLFTIKAGSSSHIIAPWIFKNGSTYVIGARISGGGSNCYKLGGSLAAEQLYHILITAPANAYLDWHNISIWLNGAAVSGEVTASGTQEFDGTGTWAVGGDTANDNSNFDGVIAALGVWDRVVSTDEKDALAAGFSPLCFPNGLLWAPDLLGYAAEIDPVSGLVATHDGTTVADHPRIIYPGGAMTIFDMWAGATPVVIAAPAATASAAAKAPTLNVSQSAQSVAAQASASGVAPSNVSVAAQIVSVVAQALAEAKAPSGGGAIAISPPSATSAASAKAAAVSISTAITAVVAEAAASAKAPGVTVTSAIQAEIASAAAQAIAPTLGGMTITAAPATASASANAAAATVRMAVEAVAAEAIARGIPPDVITSAVATVVARLNRIFADNLWR